MILYLAVAVATLAACEVALRLPLGRVLTTLTSTARKATRVVGSKRISDTWKEKVLPAYAGRIMVASLSLFGCILAIALPVILLTALVTGSLATASAVLMRPLPLLEMIAVGGAYVWARKKAFA